MPFIQSCADACQRVAPMRIKDSIAPFNSNSINNIIQFNVNLIIPISPITKFDSLFFYFCDLDFVDFFPGILLYL